MAKGMDKQQPVVGTKLDRDEFEDLHILATMRGETVSDIVTELIRKELKFRQAMIDQFKTSAPQLLEAMQAARLRKGRKRANDTQRAVSALNGLSNMLTMSNIPGKK